MNTSKIIEEQPVCSCNEQPERVTCCARPKLAANEHGEPYCARCWTSLTPSGLPIPCHDVAEGFDPK